MQTGAERDGPSRLVDEPLCEKAVDCMSLYCSAWKGTGNNYKKNYKKALCLRVTGS